MNFMFIICCRATPGLTNFFFFHLEKKSVCSEKGNLLYIHPEMHLYLFNLVQHRWTTHVYVWFVGISEVIHVRIIAKIFSEICQLLYRNFRKVSNSLWLSYLDRVCDRYHIIFHFISESQKRLKKTNKQKIKQKIPWLAWLSCGSSVKKIALSLRFEDSQRVLGFWGGLFHRMVSLSK